MCRSRRRLNAQEPIWRYYDAEPTFKQTYTQQSGEIYAQEPTWHHFDAEPTCKQSYALEVYAQEPIWHYFDAEPTFKQSCAPQSGEVYAQEPF